MSVDTSVITIREATVITKSPMTMTEIEPLSEDNFLRMERMVNFLTRDPLSESLCSDSCTEILLTQFDGLWPRAELFLLSPTVLKPRTEMLLRTCGNLSLCFIINIGKG